MVVRSAAVSQAVCPSGRTRMARRSGWAGQAARMVATRSAQGAAAWRMVAASACAAARGCACPVVSGWACAAVSGWLRSRRRGRPCCQGQLGGEVGGADVGEQLEVGGQAAEPGVAGLLGHVVAGVEAGDGLRERAVARGVGGDPGEQVDQRPEPVGFGVEQRLGLGAG